jgi:hypothetical protein
MLPFVIEPFFQSSPSELATQLDINTVDDLCRSLELPSDDARCQPGAEMYIYDFMPAFEEHFELGVATYEDVTNAFGKYEDFCEQRVTTSGDYSYFRCWYDFNDSLYPVVFRFSGEQDTVDQIALSTGG